MHLTISRKALHAGLQSIARAVSTRSSLPILSNVLLQTNGDSHLVLRATDLELGIALEIGAVAVRVPGSVTLPAKVLGDIVAALPDSDVTIEVDANSGGSITCGKSVYRIHGLPAAEYPPAPLVTDAATLDIGTDILRRALQRTLSAVSRDDTRPVLTGVRIEADGSELRFAATDTHRLAVDRSPLPNELFGIIVPARAMREVERLLADADTAHCAFGQNEARFAIGAAVVTTRLIEGRFPAYERVIPTTHTFRLTVDAAELKRAVKRAAVVARENASRLEFCADINAAGEVLRISAEAGTVGSCSEEVGCELQSGERVALQFCLNAGYLLDALDAIGGDTLALEGTEPLSPMTLRATGDASCTYVVMPKHK